MRHQALIAAVLTFALFGCGAAGSPDVSDAGAPASLGAQANVFNPWMSGSLPNSRVETGEMGQMLNALGAKNQSIENEAKHRQNWREEIYPVVFGKKDAPNEIIAILDFARPASAELWKNVMDAAKSLNPAQTKIVVFGKSSEPYGTDLMGLAIWIAKSRPGQAMPYLAYALNRWNEAKAAQKSQGMAKRFVNEYDSAANPSDFPIHYAYFSRLNPPVPSSQDIAVSRYCFDAGNVNMYQATQVCEYYGVKSLPALIVNGKALSAHSSSAILGALK